MEGNEALKDRMVELQLLVDDDRSEPADLKQNISAFGSREVGRELRPFQVEGASYLVNGSQGNVLAMIRPPGDGKSMTYIVAGCRSCGITVVIQPTLTLGADQCSSLKALGETLTLQAFNLDEYKTPETWKPIVSELEKLKDLPLCAVPRVFLVVSPQCVTDEKLPWNQLLLDLAAVKLVRLLVVDEFHVWCKQGRSFRPEFKKAGKKLIRAVTKKSPLTSVVMFTATCQLKDIALIETICGAQVRRLLWATPREMQKRAVKIVMLCRSQFGTVAKKVVREVLLKPGKKAILYSDFKEDVEGIAQNVRDAVNEIEGVDADCLEITGEDKPEQKGFNIDIFCENVEDPEEKKLVGLYRVLAATSGSASTGIDPPNVGLVARKGFPPSLTSFFQELGRLHRGASSPDDDYLYYIVISVGSYAGLLLRTEMSDTARKAEKATYHAEHSQVLRMLVLDDGCFMYSLEQTFGRPGSDDTLEESCNGMCPVCSGARLDQSAPFYEVPLQRSLAKIFLESASVNLKKDFVSKLKSVSLKEGVWACASGDSTTTRTTIETYYVEMLVLQLIAAEILLCDFVKKNGNGKNGEIETQVHVRGASNDDRTGYRFSEPNAFTAIPKRRSQQPAARVVLPSNT